ncbi:MAG: hypothetical protein A2Y96_00010 [Firmicutes bacterium RBG_13_65_8]|nr:MAG: hypothetical protein A2Y96_00010 [Firmicutes bacterium RBG_13_65_8]
MYTLRVEVTEVRGFCDLPHRPGDYFEVRAGRLFVPEGKFVCIWALGAMLPMLVAKEREIAETNDWLPRTDLITCPDPEGRVVWRVRQVERRTGQDRPRGAAVETEHAAASGTRDRPARMSVDGGLCDGCGKCVEACPQEPPAVRLPGPAVCRQCGVAPCVEACPNSALSRHPDTMAVLVDRSRCEGCGACVDACALSGVVIAAGKAVICDLCGGNPRCVQACGCGALGWGVSSGS